MGIARPFAEYLVRRVKELGISGRALTIGRQDIEFDLFDSIRITSAIGGFERRDDAISLPQDHFIFAMIKDGSAFRDYGQSAGTNRISDKAFFRLMGFERVESTDVSGFEGADHLIDLNQANAAHSLQGQFDLIHNGGTLEHIFHVPNALANLHEMLKIGGFIVHEVPANNCVDHGFYQFSPTLFYDFYRANGYRLHDQYLVRRMPDADGAPYFWSSYEPGNLDAVSFGGLDDAVYFVVTLAERTEHATGNVVPQQNHYRRRWGSEDT